MFVNCYLPIEKDCSVGHQIWGWIHEVFLSALFLPRTPNLLVFLFNLVSAQMRPCLFLLEPQTKKTPKITACYRQGKAIGPMIIKLKNSWFSPDHESVSFHYRETICKARRLRSLSHSKMGNKTRATCTCFAVWLQNELNSDVAQWRPTSSGVKTQS